MPRGMEMPYGIVIKYDDDERRCFSRNKQHAWKLYRDLALSLQEFASSTDKFICSQLVRR